MLGLSIRPPSAFAPEGLTEVHAWRDESGEVCARAYTGGGHSWIRWIGFAAFRFDASGIVAVPEREVDPGHIADLCRRSIEPLALQALGRETLHASAVRGPSGLVLFCGPCESGKSTLAYALSRRGWPQFADDSVVVDAGERSVRALALPFGVRLRAASSAVLGDPDPHGVLDAPSTRPRPVSTSPVSRIFVLRRVDGASMSADCLDPGAAFVALLAHARSFDSVDASARQRLLEAYLRIAAIVPVHDLAFGAGLDRLDALLDLVESAADLRLEAASA
ncbi:MAG TPA: hypothetical protein VL309_10200 [Vicinamibacterales bacterium]|nr:hypothetical protein [Vicinamibacterales bacterium]